MLSQLAKARRFDAAASLPLRLGARRVGWVQPAFAQALRAHPGVFAAGGDAVDILSTGDALDAAVRALAERGWISGWRDERYDVRDGDDVLFTLERAAFRRFGLCAQAAHLNGWVRCGDGWKLWVARRSHAKPIDPGMLDNLVGGGIASGSSARETLVKECAEEAGIPAGLARKAAAAGRFRITREVPDGVHDEILHAYDLELPAGFTPQNRDGEVVEFALLDADALAARLAADAFTVDAGAVTIDFLWRKSPAREAAIGAALAALRPAPGAP